MTKLSASEAKIHFGALIDKVQREPVTIERQGRPVAVVVSFDTFMEQAKMVPSKNEKKVALRFLNKWAKRSVTANAEKALKGDVKAQAIWDKYSQSA